MRKNNLAVAARSGSDAKGVVSRVVSACEDVKARDVAVVDVQQVSDLSDYFVIASGRSDRQVQGITNRILDALDEIGVTPMSIEGYEDGQWVLIDFGDVVVHIFYEPLRAHYNIEGLWANGKRMVLHAESAS